jgi:hypothetical protein
MSAGRHPGEGRNLAITSRGGLHETAAFAGVTIKGKDAA